MSWIQTTKHLLIGGLIGSGITSIAAYTFSCKHRSSNTQQIAANNMNAFKKEFNDSVLPRLNQLETQVKYISENKAEKSQLEQFKQEFIKMHEDLERDQRYLAQKTTPSTIDPQRRSSNPKEMISM